MPKYLKIQETPVIDNVTADGHVGSRLPWPVVADPDGTVVTPSSMLRMDRVVGFRDNVHAEQVDVFWSQAFSDPSGIVGMYMVYMSTDGRMLGNISAVDSAEIVESEHEIPVER